MRTSVISIRLYWALWHFRSFSCLPLFANVHRYRILYLNQIESYHIISYHLSVVRLTHDIWTFDTRSMLNRFHCPHIAHMKDATWMALDKYIKCKVDEDSRKKLKTTAQKRKYVQSATRFNLWGLLIHDLRIEYVWGVYGMGNGPQHCMWSISILLWHLTFDMFWKVFCTLQFQVLGLEIQQAWLGSKRKHVSENHPWTIPDFGRCDSMSLICILDMWVEDEWL